MYYHLKSDSTQAIRNIYAIDLSKLQSTVSRRRIESLRLIHNLQNLDMSRYCRSMLAQTYGKSTVNLRELQRRKQHH